MNPYYENEYGVLYHGDCLEIMETLNTMGTEADTALSDPPYGTTACKWDAIVPLDAMWRGLNKIVKPTGTYILTAAQPFTTALISSNIERFKYCWYWNKNFKTGHLNAKKMPMRSVEDVTVFYTHPNTYNPQGITEHGKVKNRGVGAKTNRPCGSVNIQSHTGYPHQQLHFSRDSVHLHPTQKPVALFEYLINTYTNKGEIVLDFCAGSGTTAVAAQNTGRKWICIEKEEKYCKVIQERLESEKSKPNDLFTKKEK